MSLFKGDDKTVAYGGCDCECHKNSNIKHITPCCYPGFFRNSKMTKEEAEDIHHEIKKLLIE